MKIFVKVGKKESKFGEIIRQKGFCFFFLKFSFSILKPFKKNSMDKVKTRSHTLTSLHPQLNDLKIKINSCLRVGKSS